MSSKALTQASDASQIAVRSWPPSRAKIRRPPARVMSWRVRKPKPVAHKHRKSHMRNVSRLSIGIMKGWQVCCSYKTRSYKNGYEMVTRLEQLLTGCNLCFDWEHSCSGVSCLLLLCTPYFWFQITYKIWVNSTFQWSYLIVIMCLNSNNLMLSSLPLSPDKNIDLPYLPGGLAAFSTEWRGSVLDWPSPCLHSSKMCFWFLNSIVIIDSKISSNYIILSFEIDIFRSFTILTVFFFLCMRIASVASRR